MITILQADVTGSEIINHKLTHVDREASVLEACKLMRESRTTELLVTGVADGALHPLGILTANDIVTRVIAAELDPAVLTTGDIAWCAMAAAPLIDSDVAQPRPSPEDHCEALAVLDGEGRLVGTVRRDEFVRKAHAA